MRAALGLVLTFATLRFMARGWVRELLSEPAFHFTYLGFDWVRPLPLPALHAVFSVMAISGALLCVGWFTRSAAAIFFASFTYVELLDQALYLNHYYLVGLLVFLMVFCRVGTALSLDSRCGPRSDGTVPVWCYWAFRAQLSIVYFYAGLAKVNPDWMFRAEPLRTWLHTFQDTPLLGPWVDSLWLALFASWAGLLFDSSVWLLLWFRKTRPVALATLFTFHGIIAALFPVGAFSWIMMAAALAFAAPDWPRRWAARLGVRLPLQPRSNGNASAVEPALTATASARRGARAAPTLLAGHLLLQALLPLRHLLYPGDVNWTNEGFRFAWRVMLIEKTGQVEFRVVEPRQGGTEIVVPRPDLTRLQVAQMSVQPDMIQQYAQHLAELAAASGRGQVRVYADAWASLNGRPAQRLLEPTVDLAAAPLGVSPKPWIVPLAPD
jgi:hypothetical protein